MSVDLSRQDLLKELEARQDEVLQQLSELELQVERALAEYSPAAKGPAASAGPRLAAITSANAAQN